MKLKINKITKIPSESILKMSTHTLIIVDMKQKKIPFEVLLKYKLKRVGKKILDLKKTPISTEMDNGSVISWILASEELSVFQAQTLLRKGFNILLQENPISINVIIQLENKLHNLWAKSAAYVGLVNSKDLPSLKKANKKKALKNLTLFGADKSLNLEMENAVAIGNTLTRELTMTPPNQLTPYIYRKRVKELAKDNKWKVQEYSMAKLKLMGAGAFYSVGQGSEPQDAAIMHLTYSPRGAKQKISLVGKGICFDTGGHNLKPAKFMNGMHEDMNGSAVVLGILQAATLAKIPVKLDCWLAIAQNHIGPKAYKQNDVVKALNGMTIEIVHTDAEGRMVLADTLTLASRKKPKAIIDFATLTGCMHVAMGDRYSGALSNQPELSCMAVGAGVEAGERIAAFPFDEDYEEDLDSQIADIKQCTLEGGPDHIHAARFLGRFVENNTPWLHVDLSSSNRKGGLGAVTSDVNGFGVNFGIKMIQKLIK
jgi:leucyl aminopeptidase